MISKSPNASRWNKVRDDPKKSLIRRFLESLFVRVAVSVAALMVVGLWFIATTFTPTAVYVNESGVVHHVFLHPDFTARMALVWAIFILPVYLGVRFICWVTQNQNGLPRA